MIDQKLINKYIERIKIDYPEDDKLMIDLQQFAQEVLKNQTHSLSTHTSNSKSITK